ncbi:hypothetical protein AAFX91_23955 [Bradyrhizobium sp. 31Argb]|uniref:hypothetical protein n=1 Tax=unclassified Bradyrhizobium TaxID=2631580 RepID=UPI00102E8028|nr:hypothetical protein [Bradyrhizobium sp. Leo170]TAI65906.1 hypothetical protein CWO89_10985 [Bradyrhizobium sp. Leo170]
MQSGEPTPIRLAQDVNGKLRAWPERPETVEHRLKAGRTSDPARVLRGCRASFVLLNEVEA